MNTNLKNIVTWVKTHPWLAGVAGTFGAAILSAVSEALVSGSQSYVLRTLRAIVFGQHAFPAIAWLVLGPLAVLGIVRIWEKYRPPSAMPDESHGVRWRCEWEGRRIIKVEPICPNPNCGHELRITQAGGQYGSDAVFVCNGPGCGFRLRHEDIPAVVLADARRDLESQASGRPPAPPKKPKARLWYG